MSAQKYYLVEENKYNSKFNNYDPDHLNIAQNDLNNIINAYRNAESYVDQVWDFSNAAKDWNWEQSQVDQFRVDIINFVADGKLPNGQSKEYNASVESYGVEVMNKIENANAKIKLNSD